MEYIIIGALLAIGWKTVSLIYGVAEELLFSRLHNAKWYQIAAGKKPRKVEAEKPGDIKAVKNKIGFY